eukprot:1649217-Rhodomonas_salina.2
MQCCALGQRHRQAERLKKKLYLDWILFLSKKKGREPITGSGGGGAKSCTMMQMEDIIEQIFKAQAAEEGRKGNKSGLVVGGERHEGGQTSGR